VKKPALRVEYIHCAILLGYVQDILLNAVTTHPDLDIETKNTVLRAVNKVSFNYSVFSSVESDCIAPDSQVIWIQNDLFARHYIQDEETSPTNNNVSLTRNTASLAACGLLALGAGIAHYVL
jgi:hypothetical protein